VPAAPYDIRVRRRHLLMGRLTARYHWPIGRGVE
jgi:hypothetical protein